MVQIHSVFYFRNSLFGGLLQVLRFHLPPTHPAPYSDQILYFNFRLQQPPRRMEWSAKSPAPAWSEGRAGSGIQACRLVGIFDQGFVRDMKRPAKVANHCQREGAAMGEHHRNTAFATHQNLGPFSIHGHGVKNLEMNPGGVPLFGSLSRMQEARRSGPRGPHRRGQ
jgi:hypothetical protein